MDNQITEKSEKKMSESGVSTDYLEKIINMKNPSAVALGSLGGKARAKNLTKEQRQEISRKGGLKKGENAKLKLAK